ncbi:MAG TPA: hypothetical protein VLF62_05925 [Candidatus Saccharimonadales bacterium]|nr:hypothetical protein [Candidatus Saccharimonadales bacterium]
MRIVLSKPVVAAVAAVMLAGLGAYVLPAAPAHASGAQTAKPQAGVTISPATLTLSLAKGASQQSATFGITNYYSTPITLSFSFGQSVATPGGGVSADKQLTAAPSSVVIQPGATVTPVVTLTDNKDLAPGSQQVELIISQAAGGSGNVSIIPSVRMPLITIKQDGAVAALRASDISKPAFAFDIPKATTFKLENTGNIVSIPRGFITITDPRGRVASQGVINTASTAVAPGGQLRLSTPLTTLHNALMPGVYRVQVSYGQGGGQQPTVATVRFFYIPVWQLVLVLVFAGMVVIGRLIWAEWMKLQRLRKAGPPADQPLSTGSTAV